MQKSTAFMKKLSLSFCKEIIFVVIADSISLAGAKINYKIHGNPGLSSNHFLRMNKQLNPRLKTKLSFPLVSFTPIGYCYYKNDYSE